MLSDASILHAYAQKDVHANHPHLTGLRAVEDAVLDDLSSGMPDDVRDWIDSYRTHRLPVYPRDLKPTSDAPWKRADASMRSGPEEDAK